MKKLYTRFDFGWLTGILYTNLAIIALDTFNNTLTKVIIFISCLFWYLLTRYLSRKLFEE